jgi:hypothetical protein
MRAVRRGDRVELTIGPQQLRGGVAAAESSPAGPTHGGSRSTERGCTGKAGRCSRPRRKFGFRRRRAPSVRRRRRVCHCVSARPCLDCSPTQAGQTLLGLAYPSPVGLAMVASGRVTPAGSSSRVVLVAVVGLGWLGVARRLSPTGPTHGRRPDRAGPARPAQIGAQVAGCRVPRARAARPSIPAREVAWTRGVVRLGGRQ